MLEPMCCWRMFSRGKCNAVSIQFVAVAPYKLTKWPQWRRPTRQRAFTWSRGYEWEWKADGERGGFITANGIIKGANNPSWTFLFRCRDNGPPWLDFAVVFVLRLSTSVQKRCICKSFKLCLKLSWILFLFGQNQMCFSYSKRTVEQVVK